MESIRIWLRENCSEDIANNTKILYGGTVTETNAENVLISKAEKKKAKKERQKQEAKQKQILRAQGDVKQKLKDNIIKIVTLNAIKMFPCESFSNCLCRFTNVLVNFVNSYFIN